MGNLFSFLNESNEDRLFKACKVNDVATARDTLAKLYPAGTTEVGRKLDSLRDDSGKSPLMIAACFSSVDIIHLLHAQGASTESRSVKEGNTALHFASEYGQRDGCMALLEIGADITATNANGFTATDVARYRQHAHVLRAIEKRTAVFYGWLKWERSSLFQAGIGKMLGTTAKESLQKKFGGEWRECWVVVTKLTGKSSSVMMCPKCRSQFTDHRDPGAKIACPSCHAELHIPPMPMISVLELAIYGTPHDARPQVTFPLSVMSVESEFRVPEMKLSAVKMFLQRPAEAPPPQPGPQQPIHGLVAGGGKAVLWAQPMLAVKAAETKGTKKVVFAVNDDKNSVKHLERFIQAIRSPPMNAVEFVRSPPSYSSAGHMIGATGYGDLVEVPITAEEVNLTDSVMWTCPLCTMENTSNASKCVACETPRNASPADVTKLRQAQEARVNQQQAARNEKQGAVIVPPPPMVSTVAEMLPLSEDDERFAFEEVPAHFLCPITGEVMDDPVVTVDGMSFERRAIQQHFRSSGAISPVTMMPLESTGLAPNLALRRAINEWKSNIPVASVALATS